MWICKVSLNPITDAPNHLLLRTRVTHTHACHAHTSRTRVHVSHGHTSTRRQVASLRHVSAR